MDRIAVDSNALVSVGYDAKTQQVEAEFPNGDVYQYSPVSESLWKDLLAAPSTGTFFMRNIRAAIRGVKV